MASHEWNGVELTVKLDEACPASDEQLRQEFQGNPQGGTEIDFIRRVDERTLVFTFPHRPSILRDELYPPATEKGSTISRFFLGYGVLYHLKRHHEDHACVRTLPTRPEITE